MNIGLNPFAYHVVSFVFLLLALTHSDANTYTCLHFLHSVNLICFNNIQGARVTVCMCERQRRDSLKLLSGCGRYMTEAADTASPPYQLWLLD